MPLLGGGKRGAEAPTDTDKLITSHVGLSATGAAGMCRFIIGGTTDGGLAAHHWAVYALESPFRDLARAQPGA
jgi:hypothetical protein